MDSLSQINTVKDLMELQGKTKEETENKIHPFVKGVLDKIFDEEPAVGQELAVAIVSALKDLHGTQTQNYVDSDNAESAAIWATDHTKLSIILDLLNEVVLWYVILLYIKSKPCYTKYTNLPLTTHV